jgi:hypothetical protein
MRYSNVCRIGFRPREAGYAARKTTRITQECSAKLRNAGCVQAQADSERRGVQRALGLGATQAVATDRQTNVASKPPSPATTLAGAIEYAATRAL